MDPKVQKEPVQTWTVPGTAARACATLWYFSVSILVTYATYATAERSRGLVASALPAALVVFYFAGWRGSRVLAALRGLEARGAFWKKHWCAAHVGAAGGFLWLGCFVLGTRSPSFLPLYVFFLPLYVWHAWNPGMVALADYVWLLVGVNGVYVAVGALADAVRRTTNPHRRGALLLSAGALISMFMAAFVARSRQPDPSRLYPSSTELSAVVALYSVLAGALVALAVGTWWRGCGKHRHIDRGPHADLGG